MRICFVSALDDSAGTTTRVHMLAKHLADFGHDVFVLEPSERVIRETREMLGKAVVIKIPFNRTPRGYASSVYARTKIVKNLCMDICIASKALPMSTLPCIFRRVRGDTPFIIDWDDYEGEYQSKRTRIVQAIVRRYERVALRMCEYVTLHSDFLQTQARKFGVNAERIYFIPQGVDVELFHPIQPKKEGEPNNQRFTLLYVATLGYTTDLEDLILFIKPLLEDNPDMRFKVVGGGPFLATYQDQVRLEGIEERVFFTGQQPFKEIPQHIADADVCLSYMQDSDGNRARSPLKVLEYMACGKPVVANAVGELKKVLQHEKNAMVFSTPEEFQSHVIRLKKDAKLRERLGKNAASFIQRDHTWEKSARKLEHALEEMRV